MKAGLLTAIRSIEDSHRIEQTIDFADKYDGSWEGHLYS